MTTLKFIQITNQQLETRYLCEQCGGERPNRKRAERYGYGESDARIRKYGIICCINDDLDR